MEKRTKEIKQRLAGEQTFVQSEKAVGHSIWVHNGKEMNKKLFNKLDKNFAQTDDGLRLPNRTGRFWVILKNAGQNDEEQREAQFTFYVKMWPMVVSIFQRKERRRKCDIVFGELYTGEWVTAKNRWKNLENPVETPVLASDFDHRKQK